ncbi:DUF4411 domain-containing protein [Photorhabdus sp. HUG-39]|uniref:DUF4411 family protein n=2 Tax=Photorhabdus TaxID=29487 RepID=A0ABX0AT11_9GAMM|nr:MULTISPECIES: DUF4411 family protein [Photorhabdus]MCC8376727.1 DUF4411 family protein [Photorhabdus bodei]MDB6374456.1 DUF4411 family protein [Photorhabdus bodei]NDL10222.1 DUF4411 family protein [Photorhabdus kayaii]NDL23903.1 DUF4411 family protein [Photorhabdus kayaii]RAX12500.1 DUF4411 domain-containing protein [Photorhabdus sp. HUG-39]
MIYLIDSNVFIQAQNEYYCFDVCPGFWEFIERKFNEGQFISIKNVYHELAKQDDAVFAWVKDRKSFFQSVDDIDTQKNFSEIVNYVNEEYSPRHKNSRLHIQTFLNVADPWIVAKARTVHATVVSHEVRDKSKQSPKPKIPDVCDHFHVPTIRTSELLRSFQVKFILEQQQK